MRMRGHPLDHTVSDQDRLDIRASLDGDADAYERLVKRYETRVATNMWRFTRDKQVLGELVQEVFVEAFLSLAGFRGRAPFSHWLLRIATRVGYRHWKHEARDRRRRSALAEWDTAVSLSRASQLQAELAPFEAAEFLYRLLEQLPPEDRLVLTLFYFEEYDTREIAEQTGWSRALVKVRSFRARKKLRALLEETGLER